MATDQLDPRRDFARDVVHRLRQAGHTAYWAGGCVRDLLLGLVPKDFDVATDATPEQIRALFGHRRTLAIGAAFGVITVVGPKGSGQVEVTTFREDLSYADGRRPEAVRFCNAETDAQRRDFTINGLFYDPDSGDVLDYVNGQKDLRDGVVRAIGEARQRFQEDSLRLLRAVRFAVSFGFRLDSATEQAIREMAGSIRRVSAERIGAEIERMLTDRSRQQAVRLLFHTGLLAELLPELAAGSGQPETLGPPDRQPSADLQETLRVLGNLRDAGLPLALAALLHRFPSPRTVAQVGKRWRLAQRVVERAAWLITHFAQISEARSLPWPRLQRILVAEPSADLLRLHAAMAGEGCPELVYCRERLALPSDQLNPAPLLTGDDLIAHGIAPGIVFRTLLEQVRDAQLEQRIETKRDALALVDRLMAGET